MLELQAKNKIAELSSDQLKQLCYGYSCDSDAGNKIKKITKYKDALAYLREQTYLGYKPCIKDIDCLKEKLIPLIGRKCSLNCTTVITDTTNQKEWDDNNPYCKSYEKWEKWSRILVRDLDIQLDFQTYDIEVISMQLTNEIITPELLVALSVVHESNELGLTLSTTFEEAKLEFSVLAEIYDFDLDFDTYLTLIDNNISFKVVKEVYNSDLSLKVTNTVEGTEIYLHTEQCDYPIDKLTVNFSAIMEHLDPDTNQSDYSSEYK